MKERGRTVIAVSIASLCGVGVALFSSEFISSLRSKNTFDEAPASSNQNVNRADGLTEDASIEERLLGAAAPAFDPHVSLGYLKQVVGRAIEEGEIGAVIDSLSHDGLASRSSEIISILFRKLTEEDLDTALAWIPKLQEAEHKLWAKAVTIATYADSNPKDALTLSGEIGGQLSTHYSNVFSSWAASAPLEAVSAWEALPNSIEKQLAFGSLSDAWLSSDEEGYIDWAFESAPAYYRRAAISSAMNRLILSNPERGFDRLLAAPLGEDKLEIYGGYFDQWVKSDLDAAATWTLQLQESEARVSSIAALVPHFAEESPQQALVLLEEISADSVRRRALTETFKRATEREPGEALALLHHVSSKTDYDVAVATTFREWGRLDSVKALDYLRSDPSIGEGLQAEILKGWSDSDPVAAAHWAVSHSEEAGDGVGVALSQLGKVDPAAAANLIPDIRVDDLSDDALSHHVVEISAGYSRADPIAAGKWAMNLTNESLRETALGTIAKNWLQYDPSNASRWVGDLPESNGRDRAVVEIIASQKKVAPLDALSWAATLHDESLRGEQMFSIISAENSVSVDDIQALKISDQEKEKLSKLVSAGDK